jgi:four helix bundle suffix protein
VNREELIPKHGGFRRLVTYQLATVIYDVTVRFCIRYIDRRSRTHDQMVQAARSGKQNIAEGSLASATSRKTELKLTGVARASLVELALDYEDFLRQRRLERWPEGDRRREGLIERRPKTADDFAGWVNAVKAGGGQSGQTGHAGQSGPVVNQAASSESSPSRLSSLSSASAAPPPSSAEISANGALALIEVCVSLLRNQLASQGRAFEEEGGFTERLYRVRTTSRGR